MTAVLSSSSDIKKSAFCHFTYPICAVQCNVLYVYTHTHTPTLAHTHSQHSRPSLAHSLLTKLLSLDGVSIAQGEAKETTLSSIVHNAKCLEALSEIKKSAQSPSTEPTSDPTPSETPPTSSQEALRSLTDIITEHSMSQDRPVVTDRPPPLMPYTSLADYLSSFTGQMEVAASKSNATPAESATLPGEKATSSSEAGATQETGTTSSAMATNSPLAPSLATSYKVSDADTVCSCRCKEGVCENGVDLLRPLASNWPCLVTTILGFYPTESCDSCTFNSVHTLDSFTSHLLLNCDSETVMVVVDTIVSNMNSVVSSLVCSSDTSLFTDGVEWENAQNLKITKQNLSLIVGRRFVESAVRVLAMNHSRAGNTLSTSQSSRQPDSKLIT